MVEVFLGHGANPNIRTNSGRTPLHCALLDNKPAILTTLLSSSKKCNLQIRDKDGKTALDYAQEKCRTDCIVILEQYTAGPAAFGTFPVLSFLPLIA